MYAKIVNNQIIRFPYNSMELRAENPNISFPLHMSDEQLITFNMLPVIEQEKPIIDRFSVATLDTLPKLVNGQWVLQWVVTAKTAETLALEDERKAHEVRAYRNGKLANCDWTQVLDAPINQTAWATYRQELRDISLQDNFPYDIIWPTQPG
jgi:hypothetical protein